MLANLTGLISHKTAVEQLSFVRNPEEEVKRALKDYPPEASMSELLSDAEIPNPDDKEDQPESEA